MVEFENVTKLYGTVIGVNDLSFTLKQGAYGLLGPNGSGKTTLINLLMGQLKPTIGMVRVLGANPWRDDSILGRIGLCPASELLVANASARQWVTFQTELHGFRHDMAQELADRSLEKVGLAGAAADRPISTYSLGMRQRTKLAQALAHEPELLVLDEPFNGLDPVGRHEMNDLLRAFVKDGGILLLASHVLHEVEAVKPNFLLICGGRLLASGSPSEVRQLLTDMPAEVRLETDDPQRLASRLLEDGLVERVKLEPDGAMVVMTRRAHEFFESLRDYSRESLVVRRMRGQTESLDELFSLLMRRHRGEL